MSNHVCMLTKVAETLHSKIIQNHSFRYTRWINKREKRTGHLFQGRYQAVLIDADDDLAELNRYDHLNPVRSGLTTKLDDYEWSVHNGYPGMNKCNWLSTDWVLQRFDYKKSNAGKAYHRYVLSGVDEEY